MTRPMLRRALAASLVALGLVSLSAQAPASNAHRIAVFGSSVANGTGDWLGHEGYTGRLRALLAPRGWEVLNQSRGGDNTIKMAPRFAPVGPADPNTRYLLPVNPKYVLLGLSLGNEGIANVKTKAEKDAVYGQFEAGMKAFIAKSRANGIVPIVTTCYTRNDFTEVEYGYTRRMNLAINTWGVPSVNFLGAVDDGTGRWARGFWNDALHPTPSGHDELLTTFVPSLFEAIEEGKPLPTRANGASFARISGGSGQVAFKPADVMHPFTLVLTARAGADGVLATIRGHQLTAQSALRRNQRDTADIEFTSLTPGQDTEASVRIENGRWSYQSTAATDDALVASAPIPAGAWHTIVVSHYVARGQTVFYVDGQRVGSADERLEPREFVIGGSSHFGRAVASTLDVKDLMIYRSALNADEVAALQQGTLLQSSLELYAPLADTKLSVGTPLENRAQSMTAATVTAGGLVHQKQ